MCPSNMTALLGKATLFIPGYGCNSPAAPSNFDRRLFFFFFFAHLYFPVSGQAMVTGVVPSSPRFLPSIFIAHCGQQSHCLSIFRRLLLTHTLALSASQFVHKKKSLQTYTSMPSGELELTTPTYTRLEDNLKCHWGDRVYRGTA